MCWVVAVAPTRVVVPQLTSARAGAALTEAARRLRHPQFQRYRCRRRRLLPDVPSAGSALIQHRRIKFC